MAEIPVPVILIVKLPTGKFDPLHSRTPARERDEHLRRRGWIERTERMPCARSGSCGNCLGEATDSRLPGCLCDCRLGRSCGSPRRAAHRRGRIGLGSHLLHDGLAGKEIVLEDLAPHQNSKRNQRKEKITTFHNQKIQRRQRNRGPEPAASRHLWWSNRTGAPRAATGLT